MAERENTGNAIPSNALKDLNDNTIILDEWTNSKSDYTQDRFGVKFKTRYKILNDLQTSVNSIQSGSFLALSGGTLTGPVTGTDFTGNNITAKTSLTVGSAKATYSTTGLNFDKPLLVNNVEVLKVGDGGISSSAKTSTDTNNLKEKTGIYKYTPNTANPPSTIGSQYGTFIKSCWSSGSSVDDNEASFIFQAVSSLRAAVGYVKKTTGELVTSELITTSNIGSYQSGLGINQTWQNVSSDRKSDVEYTNTTGKPIEIKVNCALNGSNANLSLIVNGLTLDYNFTSSTLYTCITCVIPNGSTYKVSGANPSIQSWFELR